MGVPYLQSVWTLLWVNPSMMMQFLALGNLGVGWLRRYSRCCDELVGEVNIGGSHVDERRVVEASCSGRCIELFVSGATRSMSQREGWMSGRSAPR